MNRRNLFMTLIGAGPLSVALMGQGKGKGHAKHGDDNDQGEDHGHFRREDYVVVQRYYTGPRDLPPGLRKKYYRTGKLPPGWEKKIQPFPVELVRALPPPPPNCERGYIDGVAVVYDRTTRVIVDAIDIVAAITHK